MANKLVILESPNKVKAVKGYLGKNYKVVASVGHVRDLPKSTLGIDIENDFAPKYINIRGKGDIIKSLKQEAKKADTVYLATDPDREGEAISWHLMNVLGLDETKAKRVRFNEVTEGAVKAAVKNPGSIDMNLVDAQQTRRILDRIVGYQLSPILWKKIKSGLSAGRVQSVATRLIVDRENEIRAFKAKEYWTIDAMLRTSSGKSFKASYVTKSKFALGNKEASDAILEKITGEDFTVKDLKKAVRYKNPMPPFITSTLQQEAYRRLGFSSAKTMKTAQELYEGISMGNEGTHGIITYMRTDSLHISSVAADSAESYIVEHYGKEYYPEKRRFYKSRSGAQEAHEAIRPSYMKYSPADIKAFLSNDQYKLYKLIWDRFLASQMASAVLDTVTIDTDCNGVPFRSSGYTIRFKGYMALYDYKSEDKSEDDEDEKDNLLPNVEEGDVLGCTKIEPLQHFTQPPARYSEGTLVKALEERGLGRPSTFAATVTTIISRGYVEREAKTLVPTPLGEITTKLMCDNFAEIVDYGFTAGMEESLDDIENGSSDMQTVLKDFYDGFEKEVASALENIDKESYKLPVVETDIVCEKCGSRMVVKSGRFGKFAACPNYPECRNTKALDKDGNPVDKGEKAEPEAAPENIKCDICGGGMVIRRGRFGKFYACASYPKCSGTKPITKEIDVPCPLCAAKLVMRRGKGKTSFYSCSKYPTCKFSTSDKPTDKKCSVCGSMLVEKRGKDGVYACVNKECDFNAKKKKK